MDIIKAFIKYVETQYFYHNTLRSDIFP